jgi:hypothetical protein
MAEHVSFVANDELADWLHDEADRRTLTVEATVQELLVAAYRGDGGGPASGVEPTGTDAGPAPTTGASTNAGGDTGAGAGTAEPAGGPDAGSVTDDDELAALADEVASQSTGTDVLSRHPEAWSVERRGGEKYYVVTGGGERSVHSSRAGAAEALERRLD